MIRKPPDDQDMKQFYILGNVPNPTHFCFLLLSLSYYLALNRGSKKANVLIDFTNISVFAESATREVHDSPTKTISCIFQ